MDAVILAVSHDEFKNMTIDQVSDFYKTDEVRILLDLKGMFDRKIFEDSGYCYWRL